MGGFVTHIGGVIPSVARYLSEYRKKKKIPVVPDRAAAIPYCFIFVVRMLSVQDKKK